MSLSNSGTNSSFTGLISRYLQKMLAWTKRRIGRYGVAFGLLAIGALLLAVALAIGTAASFHYIELHYGIWTAYGIVGGSFAGLAAVALIAGWIILKAKPPAMPAPPAPARLLRQAVAPMAFRLVSTADRQQALTVVDQRKGCLRPAPRSWSSAGSHRGRKIDRRRLSNRIGNDRNGPEPQIRDLGRPGRHQQLASRKELLRADGD